MTIIPHHSIYRRGVQLIVTLALAFALPQAAEAKHHHHHAQAAKHVAAPLPDSESALRFASDKAWDKALFHARRSRDPVLIKLVTWMYLQDADARAQFRDITNFLRLNPQWPRQERLHLRAEQSLAWSEVPDATLIAWFAANPPVSGIGKIKLAELMIRRGVSLGDVKVRFLVRDAWRNGDFEEEEEKRLLAVYGDLLTPEDHIARADRLLWEDKPRAARRLLDLLPEDYRALMHARIALAEASYDSDFYLSHVPHALLPDPGLTFQRIQWCARKGDKPGALSLLLSAQAPLPHPEKWWKIRDLYIRDAIGDRDFRLARRLLVNHGLTDGADAADALWLSGWVSLRFMNDPRNAYLQFYRMFDMVRYPVSRARAAYWAGRAAEVAGDPQAAHGWYLGAAAYPTTFYGQLAYAKLYPHAPLRIPAEPAISDEARQAFNANEMTRAVQLAAKAHEFDLATALVHYLVETAPDAAQAAEASALGNRIKSAMLSVRAAKRAGQRGVMLVKTGFPVYRLPPLPIDPALALAITRQESEFDANARSKSGAVGMMQLLPKTAREMARKNGLGYADSRLYDPAYNMQLGSAYLGRLIKAYDGSYVLAAAAYNAGPGNVREWMRTFGSPVGGSTEAVVDWIEEIPFAETRNYVQRVMENFQVYRRLLASNQRQEPAIETALARTTP